ncbi:hypothetical protein PPN31114_00201 [Pandoraea pneumonica]|uniref:Uncharacterized protein n=1 Tax=Pandoraea pneumonica TaxID=2508299 RepID=A0A5E4RJI1_9BURK|nr:hypothetical protein [Pandoraea pneumonica]VVD63011.1 hypothetical protein PPN31114_00201 [Pandoraea pneumonica]
MNLRLTEAVAFEKFAMRSTVPLFLNWDGRGVALVGTGTLFEIAGRFFIVTALHIFAGFAEAHFQELAFSDDPIDGNLHTFGSTTIAKSVPDHHDVAVVELLDQTTIGKLRTGWRFLTLDNVGLPTSTLRDGALLLAGYPRSDHSPEDGWVANGKVRGRFVSAYSQRIPTIPANADQPADLGIDIFCDYGRTATTLDVARHCHTATAGSQRGICVGIQRVDGRDLDA